MGNLKLTTEIQRDLDRFISREKYCYWRLSARGIIDWLSSNAVEYHTDCGGDSDEEEMCCPFCGNLVRIPTGKHTFYKQDRSSSKRVQMDYEDRMLRTVGRISALPQITNVGGIQCR